MKAVLIWSVGLLFGYQTCIGQTDSIRLNMADSLANAGKFDQAEAIYLAELGKDSSTWFCYFRLGAIETVREQFAQAVKMYTRALQLEPRSSIYLQRAEAYYSLENMDAFCIDIDLALAIFGRSSDRLESDELAMRKELQKRRIEICDTAQPSYFVHRGLAALNRSDTAAMAAAYSMGLARFPEDAALKNFQGNFYGMIGEQAKARENYLYVLDHLDNLKAYLANTMAVSEPLQIEMFIAGTRVGLAETYFSEGNFDKAEKVMNGVIASLPKTPTIAPVIAGWYDFYGLIWLNMGAFGKAKEQFKFAINLDNTYSTAYANFALTILADQSNRTNTARRTILNFGISQKNNQLNAVIPINNDLKLDTEELSRALYFIDKAIKISENDPNYNWIRGDIKYMLGMRDFCLDYHASKIKGNHKVQIVIDERCK